jgi:adenylate cyclase
VSVKTENLAILFTDIAGFTEATSKQSRVENEKVLTKHNTILLPIVRSFKGRHVKSIGDALLLTFRSPTDAMLCAMAMQDALHEYNQTVAEREAIHIRIAASLGEVRVTKSDIFGEPVNVTSRIEGITPADEIYLSEAIYLAMNKAEVPTQEVGREDLKGIANDVRIYCIPRFASLRLVNESAEEPAVTGGRGLSYPFGGAHLSAMSSGSESTMAQWKAKKWMLVPLAASFFAIAFVVALQSKRDAGLSNNQADWAAMERQELTESNASGIDSQVVGEQLPGALVIPNTDPAAANVLVPSAQQSSPPQIVQQMPNQNQALAVQTAEPSITPAPSPILESNSADIPEIALKVNSSRKTPPPVARVSSSSTQSGTTVPRKPAKPSYTRFSQLKAAYRAGQVTRDYYETRYRQLKIDRDQRIRALKTAYNEGRMSKVTYKERYRQLVYSYE